MKNVMLILSLILFASCGKKDPQPEPPEIKQGGESSIPTRTTVSWESAGRKYEIKRLLKGSKDLTLDREFTLSEEIPDSITLDMGAELLAEKSSVEATGKITEEQKEKENLPAVILKVEMKGSALQVSGLRSYFGSKKGRRGVLKVNFQKKEKTESLGSISMTLQTLNPMITVSVESVNDSYSRLKKLLSAQARLDLLQIVRLKNEGNTRVELKSKVKMGGYLFRNKVEYGYTQQHCHCDTWQRPGLEQFETEFELLSLNQEIMEDWTKLAANESNSVTLEPKAEAIYGLYGKGDQLVSYVDNGVPNTTHTMVDVIVSCEEPDSPDPDGGKGHRRRSESIPVKGAVPYGIDVNGVSMHLENGKIMVGIRNATFDEIDDPATSEVQVEVGDRGVF